MEVLLPNAQQESQLYIMGGHTANVGSALRKRNASGGGIEPSHYKADIYPMRHSDTVQVPVPQKCGHPLPEVDAKAGD